MVVVVVVAVVVAVQAFLQHICNCLPTVTGNRTETLYIRHMYSIVYSIYVNILQLIDRLFSQDYPRGLTHPDIFMAPQHETS